MLTKVKIESGWIEGTSAWDQTISVFRGIPYAAPPVGELRWRSPQPHEPWEGVLPTKEFGAVCPQSFSNITTQFPAGVSEDCLFMNVWTNAKTGDEKMPVLFYTHGGGYTQGAGNYVSYDGEAFAKNGVVVVTYNYRLNIFGYMCHPDLKKENETGSTGNYGLQDQIFALKWVRRNIAAFGGDPDNITIMGLSAGSGSTRLMTLTPQTKGDFKNVVSMSCAGHVYSIWESNYTDSSEHYIDLKAVLGVDTIEEARALPWETVNDLFLKQGRNGYHAGPVVDGTYLPLPVLEMQEKNMQHEAQYMIGCSNLEIAGMGAGTAEFVKEKGAAMYGDRAQEFFDIMQVDDPEAFAENAKMINPKSWRAVARGFCQLQNDLGRKPAYLYLWNRKPPTDVGTRHGMDLFYTFKVLSKGPYPYNGVDFEISNMNNAYFTNYFKTGNPNGDGLPVWTPYTEDAPYTMIFDEKVGMQKVKELPLVEFMNDFTREHGKKTRGEK